MGMEKKWIYVDNAATTALSERAFEAMKPYFAGEFGNPSSIHSAGQEGHKALESSRRKIAEAVGGRINEIFFTGGGTESDNWVLRGLLRQSQKKGRHIITTGVEHSAVFETAEALKEEGAEVTYLPADSCGRVAPEDLAAAIRDDTVLVSVIMANNEIGTILPIKELCGIAHARGVKFHTDAVQAVGHVPIDVRDLDVDFLSLSSHKFRGPKGVGAVFARAGHAPASIITGGGQEKNRRAGTENVPGVVGMAEALCEAVENMEENQRKVTAMRDRIIESVLEIPGSCLSGDPVNRLPGTASFLFDGLESKPMVTSLSAKGVCVGSGSACSSGAIKPSRVILATGVDENLAYGTLRISLNECNTMEEVDYIVRTLPVVVAALRRAKFGETLAI